MKKTIQITEKNGKVVEWTINFSEWARWCALDKDGTLVEYAIKPTDQYSDTEWYTHQRTIDNRWRAICRLIDLRSGWDWRKTLRKLSDYR